MKRIVIDGHVTPAEVRALLREHREILWVVIGDAPDTDMRRELGVWARYAPEERAEALDGADMVIGHGDHSSGRGTRRMGSGGHMSKSHQFLWFDLETTGLDPARGRVLEFAAVLCEDAKGDDFAIVQQFSGVVGATGDEIAALHVDPFVQKMHHHNGLWAEVLASTTTIEQVDEFLAALAESAAPGQKVMLAGNSIHFDLAWCRVHMPRFAERLSHRVFDVSTLWRAIEAWGPTIEKPKREAHRALADVLASIEEARVARRAMGWAA